MGNEAKPEDFIFSLEQLRLIADNATRDTGKVNRTYIKGKEFTSRVPSGTKTNFEDAVLVEANIIGASQNSPVFLITDVTADAEDLLKEVNQIIDAVEEVQLARLKGESQLYNNSHVNSQIYKKETRN